MPAFHFISGLPRSGSTLLAALLAQNPHFHATMSTGLVDIWGKAIMSMGTETEFGGQYTEEQRLQILRSLFYGFYHDMDKMKVVFNTNRGWSRWASIIAKVWPNNGKIICCVRDPAEIVNSLEHIFQDRPWAALNFYGSGAVASTMNDRFAALQKTGTMLGGSIANLMEGMKGLASDRILIVPYDVLCKHPLQVLEFIYGFIGVPFFGGHNPTSVRFTDDRYDKQHGTEGLHTVRNTVSRSNKPMLLTDQIIESAKTMALWKNLVKTNARVLKYRDEITPVPSRPDQESQTQSQSLVAEEEVFD